MPQSLVALRGPAKNYFFAGPGPGPIWSLLRPIFGPSFGSIFGLSLGPGPMVGPILWPIFTYKNGPEANLTHMAAQNISTTSPGSKFRDLQVCQNPNGPKFGSQIGSIAHNVNGPKMGPLGAPEQKSKNTKKCSRLAMMIFS